MAAEVRAERGRREAARKYFKIFNNIFDNIFKLKNFDNIFKLKIFDNIFKLKNFKNIFDRAERGCRKIFFSKH